MNAIVFDTLRLSKALQAEFSPAQAETLAAALAESTFDTIATKGDIADVKVDIAGVKAEIASVKAEMIKDFSVLRADLVRWIVTAIAFNFVAVVGLVIALIKVFGR